MKSLKYFFFVAVMAVIFTACDKNEVASSFWRNNFGPQALASGGHYYRGQYIALSIYGFLLNNL